MSLTIRDAGRADVPAIFDLIGQLAVYEKLAHEVVGSEALLEEHLFGDRSLARVFIAELDEELAGFALYFTTYSTFLTRPGLYLEDLFVRPEFRKRGVGVALLRALARRAVEEECPRMEWVVLDWNRPAIDFYEALGATQNDGWLTYRLTGAPLAKLAEPER